MQDLIEMVLQGRFVAILQRRHGAGEFRRLLQDPIGAQFQEIAQTHGVLSSETQISEAHTVAQTMHLLIADDEADSATMLAALMKAYLPGVSVDVAHNGRSALESMGRRRPDAAILDLNMPNASGQEVAREIRSRFSEPAPCLIALSGNLAELDALRGRGIFDHLIAKPCLARDLAGLIRR